MWCIWSKCWNWRTSKAHSASERESGRAKSERTWVEFSTHLGHERLLLRVELRNLANERSAERESERRGVRRASASGTRSTTHLWHLSHLLLHNLAQQLVHIVTRHGRRIGLATPLGHGRRPEISVD